MGAARSLEGSSEVVARAEKGQVGVQPGGDVAVAKLALAQLCKGALRVLSVGVEQEHPPRAIGVLARDLRAARGKGGEEEKSESGGGGCAPARSTRG